MSQQQTFPESTLPIFTAVEFIQGDDNVDVPPNITTHVIGLKTTSSDVNNDNGIMTSGNIGTNTETITLTNRISGSGTTNDGVTTVIISSFDLGTTPGAYIFNSRVVAFNIDDGTCAVWAFQTAFRTDGVTSTRISTGNQFFSEEGAMSGVALGNVATGNLYELEVTGLAGKTIHYRCLTEYIFVS